MLQYLQFNVELAANQSVNVDTVTNREGPRKTRRNIKKRQVPVGPEPALVDSIRDRLAGYASDAGG
jgi:hypothetical protein